MKYHDGHPGHAHVEGHMPHKPGKIMPTGISDIGPVMKAHSASGMGYHGEGGGHPFQQQSGHHSPNMDQFHSNDGSHEDRVKKGHP